MCMYVCDSHVEQHTSVVSMTKSIKVLVPLLQIQQRITDAQQAASPQSTYLIRWALITIETMILPFQVVKTEQIQFLYSAPVL